MLTQTTITGIKILIYLTLHGEDKPVSPRKIAGETDSSASYMAKITRLLVKANLLKARKGIYGGVQLQRNPSEISLLSVVEACQGRIVGDHCSSCGDPKLVCAFHEVMFRLHESVVGILEGATLKDLSERPHPIGALMNQVECLIDVRKEQGKQAVV